MAPCRSLTARYEGFLLTPRSGPGVCSICFNLTDGYDLCFACTRQEQVLDALVPISYSIAHEQLHAALAGYKRIDRLGARLLGIELAAVLWRFLDGHEGCLASAAGTDGFEVVTTVPSSDPVRDESHPLRWVVGELVGSTRGRYERLLTRSRAEAASRSFSPARFLATRALQGQDVLLIDDTWTTGASAQSAAASLRAAGCGALGAVVIGRHVNREWGPNDQRLRALPGFDWARCALCQGGPGPASARVTEATAA